MTIRLSSSPFGVITGVFVAVTLLLPLATDAQAQVSMSVAANAMCNPWIPKCGCDMIPDGKGGCMGGKNTFSCPPGVCLDTVPTGIVLGICEAMNKCRGVSYPDQQGQSQSPGGMEQFQKMMQGLMEQLMKQMQGQGGGGGGQGQGGASECPQLYPTSDQDSDDPCAYYVPPASSELLGGFTGSTGSTGSSGSSNVSDTLLNLLGGGSSQSSGGTTGTGNTGNTGQTSSSNSNAGSGQVAVGNTTKGSSTPAIIVSTQQPFVGLTPTVRGLGSNTGQGTLSGPETRGDIVFTETGATIFAGSRDPSQRTEVAGFYGTDASGAQPQGIVAGLCQKRPWAASFVSYVIPPTFFDGLCTWRGYTVGAPAPIVSTPTSQSTVIVQQAPRSSSSASSQASTTRATTTPAVEAKVDIWAVPPTVSLGTRTSIFWNTRGVEECSITSPDGSFSETALSGGAATVPLTGPTTFSISCLTAEGSPVTDFVTVELRI